MSTFMEMLQNLKVYDAWSLECSEPLSNEEMKTVKEVVFGSDSEGKPIATMYLTSGGYNILKLTGGASSLGQITLSEDQVKQIRIQTLKKGDKTLKKLDMASDANEVVDRSKTPLKSLKTYGIPYMVTDIAEIDQETLNMLSTVEVIPDTYKHKGVLTFKGGKCVYVDVADDCSLSLGMVPMDKWPSLRIMKLEREGSNSLRLLTLASDIKVKIGESRKTSRFSGISQGGLF